MTDEEPRIVERGLVAMSDSEWDEAVRQAGVIAPLAALDVVGRGGQSMMLPRCWVCRGGRFTC